MMTWIDMAGIIFVCTAVNHLGMVQAIERCIGKSIPVVNCPKCFSFWATLACCLAANNGMATGLSISGGFVVAIHMLAISFFAAWLAIWLELLMGIIDKIYMLIYEKIYPDTDNNDSLASDSKNGNSASTVPEL